MAELTQERLTQLLHYEPDTGVFLWRAKCSKYSPAKIGERAESVTSQGGYLRIKLLGKEYRAHRLAWFYVFGVWPRNEIDHVNGRPSDNRIENLRDVDRQTNGQNQRRARRGSISGVLGACYDKQTGKFKAQIRRPDGKYQHLGRFGTAEEASQVYLNAKRAMHAGCTL